MSKKVFKIYYEFNDRKTINSFHKQLIPTDSNIQIHYFLFLVNLKNIKSLHKYLSVQ